MKGHYKKITVILYDLNEYSSVYFLKMSVDLKKLYSKARNIIEEIIIYLKKEETNEDSSLIKNAIRGRQSIDNIIISLQYHDIIKQKLEHILTTNYEIVGEFILSAHQSDVEYKYINALPSIARLHIGQLIQINKECQNAIENIITNLTSILNELAAISAKATHDNYSSYVLSKELQVEIKETLGSLERSTYFNENVAELICELSKIENSDLNILEGYDAREKLKIIENIYTMKSERVIHEALLDNTNKSENEILNNIDISNDSSIELF